MLLVQFANDIRGQKESRRSREANGIVATLGLCASSFPIPAVSGLSSRETMHHQRSLHLERWPCMMRCGSERRDERITKLWR